MSIPHNIITLSCLRVKLIFPASLFKCAIGMKPPSTSEGSGPRGLWKISVLTLILFILTALPCKAGDNSSMKIWYNAPAGECPIKPVKKKKKRNDWLQALPLGNGRLGAMVFGRTHNELIQLNEESLWAGQPVDTIPENALKNLPAIRRLLFEGKNKEARDLARKSLTKSPARIRSYQSLGELHLDLIDNTPVEDYYRELDMESGLIKVSFRRDNIRFIREHFISAPDDLFVIRITSNKKGKISLVISITRQQDAQSLAVGNNILVLRGQIMNKPNRPGMRFEARLNAVTRGGKITAEKNTLQVENADSLTIILTGATDYELAKMNFNPDIDPGEICRNILKKASEESYESLKRRHTAEHRSMFNRVSIKLGKDPQPDLPTNERLKAVIKGKEDLQLIEQYFQFGRYLLMSSSRSPGRLPANLQGIWNNKMRAPWNSDFHVNINLQMNYWPADIANLPETILPLAGLLYYLRESGSKTARMMYGCNGWTMHHLTDVFGRTTICDGIKNGMFPMGGPWISLPLWRHYEFTGDNEFLKNKAYPIMKGAALFVLDFLVKGPDGYLVTAPSYSPEHGYKSPDGATLRITYAPTMDIGIIHDLFIYCIAASKVLNIDKGFREKLASALEKLPPLVIGKDGTIQEWIKDYEDPSPGHRHVSHLFALHPGEWITPRFPKLFEAARKTIEKRFKHGGGGTGWSRAWTINFFARLKQGDMAYKHLLGLLRKNTTVNLFDMHPPFQIDGNFGGTEGIAEMLLQSHEGRPEERILEILPALPSAWPGGKIRGLRARGNFQVNIEWSDLRADKITLLSGSGKQCRLKYASISRARVAGPAGREIRYKSLNNDLIEFDTKAGETYIVSKIPKK